MQQILWLIICDIFSRVVSTVVIFVVLEKKNSEKEILGSERFSFIQPVVRTMMAHSSSCFIWEFIDGSQFMDRWYLMTLFVCFRNVIM